MDDHGSERLRSSLRDSHQHAPVAAGVLAWDQAEPSCQMAAILELRAIADGSDHRGCRLWPDPFDPGDPLTRLAGAEHALDLLVKGSDPPVEIAEQIVK